LDKLENDENLEDLKKIDKVLAVLCFLVSAFIGYLLFNYLPI